VLIWLVFAAELRAVRGNYRGMLVGRAMTMLVGRAMTPLPHALGGGRAADDVRRPPRQVMGALGV
jgi:hypothetical protein